MGTCCCENSSYGWHQANQSSNPPQPLPPFQPNSAALPPVNPQNVPQPPNMSIKPALTKKIAQNINPTELTSPYKKTESLTVDPQINPSFIAPSVISSHSSVQQTIFGPTEQDFRNRSNYPQRDSEAATSPIQSPLTVPVNFTAAVSAFSSPKPNSFVAAPQPQPNYHPAAISIIPRQPIQPQRTIAKPQPMSIYRY